MFKIRRDHPDEEATNATPNEHSGPGETSSPQVSPEMVGTVRSWLERNEVFFTVLAALFLTSAGFAVSVASYYVGREANQVARNQLNLTERQTEAAEMQTIAAERQAQASELEWTPHFTYASRYDAKTRESVVELVNGGAPVGNWDVLEFDFLILHGSQTAESVAIPIVHYGRHLRESRAVGHVATLQPRSRHSEPADPTEQSNDFHVQRLREEVARRNGPLGSVELNNFLRIHYGDRLGGVHVKYFYLQGGYSPPITMYQEIDEEVGSAIALLWEDNLHRLNGAVPGYSVVQHTEPSHLSLELLEEIWRVRNELEPLPLG